MKKVLFALLMLLLVSCEKVTIHGVVIDKMRKGGGVNMIYTGGHNSSFLLLPDPPIYYLTVKSDSGKVVTMRVQEGVYDASRVNDTITVEGFNQ